MAVVRSKLVKYRISAIDPKLGERLVWEIQLIRNRWEDRRDWCIMAKQAGFTDISLTRVNPTKVVRESATTPKQRKPDVQLNSDIAREGLKLLDQILADRRAKAAKAGKR